MQQRSMKDPLLFAMCIKQAVLKISTLFLDIILKTIFPPYYKLI